MTSSILIGQEKLIDLSILRINKNLTNKIDINVVISFLQHNVIE